MDKKQKIIISSIAVFILIFLDGYILRNNIQINILVHIIIALAILFIASNMVAITLGNKS